MADTETAYEPRLKRVYREEVRKTLQDQFSYQNEMQVPRVDKIVINMGVGEATADSKKPTVAAEDLGRIAGQKPVITWSCWPCSSPFAAASASSTALPA